MSKIKKTVKNNHKNHNINIRSRNQQIPGEKLYKEVEKLEGQIFLPLEEKRTTTNSEDFVFISIVTGTVCKTPGHDHVIINS